MRYVRDLLSFPNVSIGNLNKWMPAPRFHGDKFRGMTIIVLFLCLTLAGCQSSQFKEDGLYLDKSTCVGMDDFGVAKMKSQF